MHGIKAESTYMNMEKTETIFCIRSCKFFSDADVSFFLDLIMSICKVRVLDYATGTQLIVTTSDEDYILPVVTGDLTETSDMPSNTSSADIDTISYYYYEDYNDGPGKCVYCSHWVRGSIDFNHSDNTLTGSITFDTWMGIR